jgi:hypothetical protein
VPAPFVEPKVDDIEISPESIAFDLVPSPKSPTTTPYDGRNFEIARSNAVPPPPPSAFLDEPTATGNSQAVENLLVQEQALANATPEADQEPRAKIRFDENRAPTTRPPPEPLATRAPDGDNPPDLLVLEEFEEADAAVTEPPPAQADIPPVAIPGAALPDLDAIEADLLEARSSVAPKAELNGTAVPTFGAGAYAKPQTTLVDDSEPELEVDAGPEIEPAEDSSRTRQHHFLEEATGERLKSSPPPEDDAPSSVRQPRESERAEDVRFDGFGPIETPSEPPPESGEIPSQRRIATPHDMERVTEAEAEIEAAEPAIDQAPDLEPEFDHEETKEVRALGRVDVVERTRIDQPVDIAVLKGEPRAVETFAAVLDAALSLSRNPPH